MAKSTNGITKALVFAVAVLGLGACESVSIINPSPENRVGSEIEVRTNEPRPMRRMVEPAFIPRAEDLVGLGEAEAAEFFGSPSLRRTDQGAQVWQYRTDACVLFLFFYPDASETARVSYVTSSGAHAEQESPGDQACVDAVTRAAANAAPEIS